MITSAMKPVCAITGGSAGVGLASAVHFGQLGYRMAICGRDAEALEAARQQITETGTDVIAAALDIGQAEAARRFIDTVLEQFGRVDVLINNAGVAPLAPVDQITEAAFDQALAVNVAAVFRTTQAIWPAMKQQGGGIIVNISSLASVDPFTGFSVYGACKAWVNLFTKAIADEGRLLGIRAYCVALGAVETRMLRGLFPTFPKNQTLSPDEVALFLGNLCEEPMRYASGQTLMLKK